MAKKIVEVTWVDVTGDSDVWVKYDPKKHKPLVMKTVGYKIADKKDHIVLCMDVCKKDGTVGFISSIPKGMIKSTRTLK